LERVLDSIYKSLKYSLIPMVTWAGVLTHRVESCVFTGQDDHRVWITYAFVCQKL